MEVVLIQGQYKPAYKQRCQNRVSWLGKWPENLTASYLVYPEQ